MAAKQKKSDRRKVEDWLNINYMFRRNIVNNMIEYTADKDKPYDFITEYEFNNIIRKIERETEFSISKSDLLTVLNSNFTPEYHPIRHYFEELTKKYEWPYDTLEQINDLEIYKLADTLTLFDSGKDTPVNTIFAEFLRNWMTASVANSMTDYGCQNQMCMVLIGDEGLRKSTWLMNLVPKCLEPYGKTSKIDLSRIDIWLDLGRIFIYNIDDQLKNLQKRDSETMKTIITQPHDLKRLPHAVFNTFIPRIANFCGSINGREFLADTGKNRRYFPFEVLNVDFQRLATIDIHKCWFEAVMLYKNGVKYWYDADQLEKFDTNAYRVVRIEEELFFQYFDPVFDEKKAPGNVQYLTATQILLKLEPHTKQKLSLKNLGEILKHIKCVNKAKKISGETKYPYWVVEKFDYLEQQEQFLLPSKKQLN